MLKTSRFRPNPTWCILRRGLNTIRGNFQTAASDSYFWKKRNDWLSYKTTTTNLNRNHMAYPTFFGTQSARSGTQCLVAVFLPLVCFLPVFFPGTVNSMRRTLFFQSDHATMSGCFSVWIMWTGNCRDVLRSAETFQSIAPFSSFILGFFCFLIGHSPSLRNWIMGSLAVIDCCLLSHIVLLTTLLSPLTPCYVTMCTSEAIVDMQIIRGAKYPDHFYTTSTGPNWYIPIILGWLHLVRDHK